LTTQGGRPATRSAWLELRAERDLMREGYEFLDEKRMIIAAEMQRQLRAWQTAITAFGKSRDAARDALALAAARHGLEGLTVHPSVQLDRWEPGVVSRRYLGVELLDGGPVEMQVRPAMEAALPSIEGDDCSRAFTALLEPAAELALRMTNLRRLIDEYVRTERRARALENVLLPDIERSLHAMEDQLEAVDREESLRVRYAGRE
jgi:V/A-type H+-transporting ATPase subunit D